MRREDRDFLRAIKVQPFELPEVERDRSTVEVRAEEPEDGHERVSMRRAHFNELLESNQWLHLENVEMQKHCKKLSDLGAMAMTACAVTFVFALWMALR